MIKIEVRLFATLAAYLPGGEGNAANMELPDGVTVRDLVQMLAIPDDSPRITLVNGRDAELDRPLLSGDVVSLFPPLAGGSETGCEENSWPGRERGFGFIELLIALIVAAVVGVIVLNYFRATEKTVKTMTEQAPLAQSRLATDLATAAALRSAVTIYLSREGKFPPDKATVDSLVRPAPTFQCPGNTYTYDPESGRITLAITDSAYCQ